MSYQIIVARLFVLQQHSIKSKNHKKHDGMEFESLLPNKYI